MCNNINFKQTIFENQNSGHEISNKFNFKQKKKQKGTKHVKKFNSKEDMLKQLDFEQKHVKRIKLKKK